jgi:hypothetical protein
MKVTSTHYIIDGVKYPRVSTIMESTGLVDFSAVPARYLDMAIKKGIDIHHICEYHLKGTLDLTTVADEYMPHYGAFKLFESRHIETLLHSELTMHCDDYAGTCDLVYLDKHGVTWLVDIKTGSKIYDYALLPLMMYRNLYIENHNVIPEVAILHLLLDGTYDIYKSTQQQNDIANNIVFVCMGCYHGRDALKMYPSLESYLDINYWHTKPSKSHLRLSRMHSMPTKLPKAGVGMHETINDYEIASRKAKQWKDEKARLKKEIMKQDFKKMQSGEFYLEKKKTARKGYTRTVKPSESETLIVERRV